ncbi:hypothetical protein like AT3G17675 [Hibiscus trionum]|uniref:Phytocyanin domain-containing protein n=1 Tax=Hibiscus trionum TaxID=183268 RepID=A0A9W7HKW7_HIBTR|nr:hypothetical protein like AT3G17675 [Hibiscus trionum]
MALCRSLVVFAIVALMAPSISLATDFVVGDDAGWGLGIDYHLWAQGKQFFVGDNLVFQYTAGAHSVYKVTGDEFRNCTVPSNSSLGSFSENDTIKLATAGNKWYICGVNDHCARGQKLYIPVLAGGAPAPAPVGSSSWP